jgi:hypothetical protein
LPIGDHRHDRRDADDDAQSRSMSRTEFVPAQSAQCDEPREQRAGRMKKI